MLKSTPNLVNWAYFLGSGTPKDFAFLSNFWATFVAKISFWLYFERPLSNFSRNYRQFFGKSRATCSPALGLIVSPPQSSRGNKFRYLEIFVEPLDKFSSYFIQSETSASSPRILRKQTREQIRYVAQQHASGGKQCWVRSKALGSSAPGSFFCCCLDGEFDSHSSRGEFSQRICNI